MARNSQTAAATPGPKGEGLYPIRTVSTMTGVNAITLRAWERRHGLVKPARTRSGHRLYRQSDIDTINRIVAVLDSGVSIGQARKALESLPDTRTKAGPTDLWSQIRSKMIEAIGQFDEDRLESVYNQTLSQYPNELVTLNVLLPLLRELGERWLNSVGSVAEEHFFSVYIRNKLGARFHHRNRSNAGPKLLIACMPGEFHEVGLLLFALFAHDSGFGLLVLGADMPLNELPHAARRARCDAIVLSGSLEADAKRLGRDIQALTELSPVPVFLGGRTSVHCHDALLQAGAIPLGTDMQVALRQIDGQLAAARTR